MNSESERSMLYFDQEPVALLSNIFQDQGTWYADYFLTANVTGELLEFIRFSRDHLSTGEFDEKTFSGFKKFYETDLWAVRRHEGEERVCGAPLFRETDLSWVV